MRLPTLPATTLALALAACVAPAQSSSIAGEWHLIGLEGQAPPAPLSISFAEDGKLAGQAPCNRYFGSYSGDLPALTMSALGATKMACPDLAAETVYFEALQAVQSAEISEGHLYLIGFEGRLMEFTRDPATDGTCLSCLARQ